MLVYNDLTHHQRSLVDLGLILHVVYTLSNSTSLKKVPSYIQVTAKDSNKHIIYMDEYGNCLDFEISKPYSSKVDQVIQFEAFYFYHVYFPDNKLTVDLDGQMIRGSRVSLDLVKSIWYKIYGESPLLMKRLLSSRDSFLKGLTEIETNVEGLVQTYVDSYICNT